jgi:RNA polymerase sigma-70 factor (ECF subfamily)
LLKTIAFSVVQDHFRAQLTEKRGGGRRQEHLEDVDNANPSPARGMRQAEREILLREIDEFLSTVTSPGTRERDRCIFWLYYRHGLTARAISQIPALALTEKGVESTIWRLTQQVRQELAEGVLRTIVGNSRTSPKGKQAGSSF